MAVMIKNTPQSPLSQSTNAPDDDASVVLPAVPIDASNAYWVAVYVRSTSNEINATNATVANAAAISSNMTATANNNSDLSLHAKNCRTLLNTKLLLRDVIIRYIEELGKNNIKITIFHEVLIYLL